MADDNGITIYSRRIGHHAGHAFVEVSHVIMLRAIFILAQIPGMTFSVSPVDGNPQSCSIAVSDGQLPFMVAAVRWAESEESQTATTSKVIEHVIRGVITGEEEVVLKEEGTDILPALFGPGERSKKDAHLIGVLWNAWNGYRNQ